MGGMPTRPTAPPIVGSGYGPYLRTPGARGFAGGGDSMYSPLDLFGITNYGEGIGGGTSMPAAEPAPVDDSFDMLRMFMELTPEEKMRVAGPNFNEMSEEEIGMAMYDFISEGRALSGGREVDYMDPEKQELPLFMEPEAYYTDDEMWESSLSALSEMANGGLASLMGGVRGYQGGGAARRTGFAPSSYTSPTDPYGRSWGFQRRHLGQSFDPREQMNATQQAMRNNWGQPPGGG